MLVLLAFVKKPILQLMMTRDELDELILSEHTYKRLGGHELIERKVFNN